MTRRGGDALNLNEVPMPAAHLLATGSDDAPQPVRAETRQLINDLRDAAQGGRHLASLEAHR